MNMYKIRIRVVSVKGHCAANLKVGDTFEIDSNGQPVPVQFCGWAFVTLWPFITPLRYGGTLPWEKDPNKAYVSCPDPENTVVFEISRTPDDTPFESDKQAF